MGPNFRSSALKILGVQTGDFSAYYDLVQALRNRDIPFVPLAPGEAVPPNVGVVILTGASGVTAVEHPVTVPFTTAEETLGRALTLLHGPGPFRRCVIGVDPGERPGVAVLADGRVLRLIHAPHPEAVRDAIAGVLTAVDADAFLVRIGNGAPTHRDRILQALAGLDVPFELVDERRTTPITARGPAERDTAAATHIALTPGAPLGLLDLRPVRPTEGELRDIQRKSRLASEGALTISRYLARNVALGRLTLDEALLRQREKA